MKIIFIPRHLLERKLNNKIAIFIIINSKKYSVYKFLNNIYIFIYIYINYKQLFGIKYFFYFFLLNMQLFITRIMQRKRIFCFSGFENEQKYKIVDNILDIGQLSPIFLFTSCCYNFFWFFF